MASWLRGGLVGLGFLGVALTHALAFGAEEKFYTLEYATGSIPGCPDRATWIQQLHAKAGYRAIQPRAAHRLSVSVEQQPERLRAVVALSEDDQVSQREFSAPAGECAALMATVALATSVALQPSLALGLPPSPPPALVEAPPPVQPLPPPASPQVPVHGVLGLGAGAAVGSLPVPTAAAVGMVGLESGAWGAFLHLRAQPFTAWRPHPEVTVRSSVFTLSASPCWGFRLARLCAELEAGWESFDSDGLLDARTVVSPVLNSGARVGAVWFPGEGGLGLAAFARGGRAWVQSNLLAEQTLLHRTSGWFGSVELALAYRAWSGR